MGYQHVVESVSFRMETHVLYLKFSPGVPYECG